MKKKKKEEEAKRRRRRRKKKEEEEEKKKEEGRRKKKEQEEEERRRKKNKKNKTGRSKNKTNKIIQNQDEATDQTINFSPMSPFTLTGPSMSNTQFSPLAKTRCNFGTGTHSNMKSAPSMYISPATQSHTTLDELMVLSFVSF